MKYFDSNYAEIHYHAEKKLVEVIWKATDIGSSEYRLTLTKALVVLKQYDVNNWLNDMSKFRTVLEEDRLWVEEFLVHNVASSGLKKAAFVLNDEQLTEKINTKNFVKAIKENNISVKSFKNREEAYKWL